MNLCLIFGYHAVIGASSYDGVCDYVRYVVTAASDRAMATGSLPLTEEQIMGLQELFFDVNAYTELSGVPPAIHQLEAGAINRRQFVELGHQEFKNFLKFLSQPTKGLADDLAKRYQVLSDEALSAALSVLYDPECILCVLEKTPLRRNVLNLIHFLRTKFQDVKIGVVTNNWEADGAYVANAMASRRTGMPVFIPGTCPQEYRDTNDTFKTKRFTTNGLFDVVVQSYVERRRKPSESLLKQAIEGLTEMSAIPEDATRSRVYVFEGHANNVAIVSKVPGVARCYHIANGSNSVYEAVCDAVKDLSQKDPRWSAAYEQLTRVVGPLFKTYPAEGWRKAESTNSDGNLLFLPPPIDSRLEKVEGVVVGPVHRTVLSDLRDRIPQCFPLSDADIANASGSSYGTSGGPVLFERFHTTVLPDAYRITLRTGSFIVRIDPKGGAKMAALVTLKQRASVPKLIQSGISLARGGVPLAKTYRIAKHLANCTTLPIERGIGFIPSETNSIGRDFFVQRYVDGRTLGSVRELSDTSVTRAYSESRTKSQYSPSPSQFVDAVLDVMTKVHAAPVPEDLKDACARVSNSSDPILLQVVKECMPMSAGKLDVNALASVDTLGKVLLGYFQKERTPSASHPCLTHGLLTIENFMFSRRSLEGNPDFPVEIVSLSNLSGCEVGDPLLDLAALALLTKSPLPEGIVGLPIASKALFPKEEEIVQRYFAKASANGVTLAVSLSEALESIGLYEAVLCYRRSCILLYGITAAKVEADEAARRSTAADRSSKLGLAIFSSNQKAKSPRSRL